MNHFKALGVICCGLICGSLQLAWSQNASSGAVCITPSKLDEFKPPMRAAESKPNTLLSALPGENILPPSTPVRRQSDLDKRLQFKAERKKYYQALIDHYRTYQLSTPLLNSVKEESDLDEAQLRPLRLEAIRKLMKNIDRDPFFSGEVGLKRLNDLVGLLFTSTLEFLSKEDSTPFTIEAAVQTIENRALMGSEVVEPWMKLGLKLGPVYCNASLHYCATPETSIREGWGNRLQNTPIGVAMAGNIVRTPAELKANLPIRLTLLKRLIENESQHQASKLSETQLLDHVRQMDDQEVVDTLSKLLPPDRAAAYRKNPEDPRLRGEIDNAIFQKLQAPRKLKAEASDIPWSYQYNAWDYRNPQLTYLLALSHPEGEKLRPLEVASLRLKIDHLAARDSGLVRIQSAGSSDPILDGFNIATHYMSPKGMKESDFKRRKKEWDSEMYEIKYPKVIREDLQSDGRTPRTSVDQTAFESTVNKNPAHPEDDTILVYRKRTNEEIKAGKRLD